MLEAIAKMTKKSVKWIKMFVSWKDAFTQYITVIRAPSRIVLELQNTELRNPQGRMS